MDNWIPTPKPRIQLLIHFNRLQLLNSNQLKRHHSSQWPWVALDLEVLTRVVWTKAWATKAWAIKDMAIKEACKEECKEACKEECKEVCKEECKEVCKEECKEVCKEECKEVWVTTSIQLWLLSNNNTVQWTKARMALIAPNKLHTLHRHNHNSNNNLASVEINFNRILWMFKLKAHLVLSSQPLITLQSRLHMEVSLILIT